MRADEAEPGSRSAGFTVSDTLAQHLYGRERELAVLHELTDHLAHGSGGALVLRGEAGIGKSSLVAATAMGAKDRGLPVLSAGGVQAQTPPPFPGLPHLSPDNPKL